MLLTFALWMSWQLDERFPVSGCVAEYSCIWEQTRFQITPLLGKPKKRTEMIILAEYSKILCIPFSTYHQPKQGISAILLVEGKSSNMILPFSFFPVAHCRFILFGISQPLWKPSSLSLSSPFSLFYLDGFGGFFLDIWLKTLSRTQISNVFMRFLVYLSLC